MAPTAPKAEDEILCVADLKEAASKKLSKTAEGLLRTSICELLALMLS